MSVGRKQVEGVPERGRARARVSDGEAEKGWQFGVGARRRDGADL